MPVAQSLADIIRQEAMTRGQLGIQKAGMVTGAIAQGAGTLQDALNQMAQNETRKLTNEGLRVQTEAGKMKLSQAQIQRDYMDRAAKLAKAGDEEGATKLALEYMRIYEPKDYAEMQQRIEESKARTAAAMATEEYRKAQTRKEKLEILKRMQGEVKDVAPGHKGVNLETGQTVYENPVVPKDKADVKVGEVVTPENKKIAVFRKQDGTTYEIEIGPARAPVQAPRDESGLTPYQSTRQQFELRKEFNSAPIVKEYDAVRQQMARVESAIARSKTDKNMVAADQALINGFNKIMDPKSVVREGEYLRTIQASPLLSRAVGKFTKVLQGGAGFTQEERNAMVSLMRDFTNDAEALYSTHASEYERLAEEMGIPTDRVVVRRDKVSPKGEQPKNKFGGVGNAQPEEMHSKSKSGKPIVSYDGGETWEYK